MELTFHARGWRDSFKKFLGGVRKELIIVAPYIRAREAEFVTTCLPKKAGIRVLTTLDAGALTNGSLETGAVKTLMNFSSVSRALDVAQLHAKVYVADDKRAIVTSANLTYGGLNHNCEYGVEIVDERAVADIRGDMAIYEKFGVDITLKKLQRVDKAVADYDKALARQKETLARILQNECSRLQIDGRTPTALFADVLRRVLAHGQKMDQNTINREVEAIYPHLCTKDVRIIDGENYGKLWKHHMRNAQQGMKQRGEVKYDTKRKMWQLMPSTTLRSKEFVKVLCHALAGGPMKTRDICSLMEREYKHLCTSERRVRKGREGELLWHSYLHAAQQQMQIRKEIEFDGGKWRLTPKGRAIR